jgi:hypothetical protein
VGRLSFVRVRSDNVEDLTHLVDQILHSTVASIPRREDDGAMKAGVLASVDPLAVAAALVAASMAAVYVVVMQAQDDRPLLWVLALLAGGALASVYGSLQRAPHRRPVLVAAGAALAVLGLLAILSIGLPILVAGGLALLAGARRWEPVRTPRSARR